MKANFTFPMWFAFFLPFSLPPSQCVWVSHTTSSWSAFLLVLQHTYCTCRLKHWTKFSGKKYSPSWGVTLKSQPINRSASLGYFSLAFPMYSLRHKYKHDCSGSWVLFDFLESLPYSPPRTLIFPVFSRTQSDRGH